MEKNRLATVIQQKEALRRDMRIGRLAQENEKNSSALADLFLHNIKIARPSVIAGYQAFRGEIDVMPLTNKLRAQGHVIALPVIGQKNEALTFRLYKQGDHLVANAMGILEPNSNAPALDPDILLVPLLAFDKNRNRLGYGGGFYDRTIAALRIRKPLLAIGIAYPYQEVASVPVEPHDMALDKIITPVNVF